MKVTATRNEERFEPIELKIVIETQEEFDKLYYTATYGKIDNALGISVYQDIVNQLKQFKK